MQNLPLGIGILIGGCVVMFLGLRAWIRNYRIRRWPRAPAKILEGEIRQPQKDVATGAYSRWEILMKYEYHVAQKKYEGSDIWPSCRLWDKPTAEKKLADLKQMRECSYDPRNPARAYLRGGSLWIPTFIVVIGMAVALTSLQLLLFVP